MRKLLIAATLLTVVATPVLARPMPFYDGSGNIPTGAANVIVRTQTAANSTAVYDVAGHKLGADSDPSVRLMLQKDNMRTGW